MPTTMPSFHDLVPHLKVTLFITGSFGVAWCWDLILYSIAHVLHGKNPLRDEIGFGDDPSAPKFWWFLLAEYGVVCGVAAVLSFHIKSRLYHKAWCAAAIQAVEFIPAPYFSGKLTAYLGQYNNMSDLHVALINLLAVGFAALLAHLAQDDVLWERLHWHLPPALQRFRPILAETLGFGLGVAWNFFLLGLFGPDQLDAAHMVGLFGYLLVVALISFKIAAIVEEHNHDQKQQQPQDQQQPTLLQRTWSMLSFAANVVVAFTTVAFVRAMLLEGWIGDILCFVILILLAALLSAMVQAVDLESYDNQGYGHGYYDEEQPSEQHQCGFGRNPDGSAMDALVFCPCVWCCCPWIPLIWLLAGITPDLHLKEKWQQLIAFCLGLATSIQAANMLTQGTNEMSVALDICQGPNYCRWPWMFIVLQIGIGIVVTAILLPLLGYVSEPIVPDEGVSRQKSQQQQPQGGEQQPLLRDLTFILGGENR